MAEHLLRHLCASRGIAVATASCGTCADPGWLVPEPALRLLAAVGVPPFEHKPRLATREVLRWADTILVMTASHLNYIQEFYPEFASRTILLREAAGFGEQDVEDPMGRPDEVYVRCLSAIRESLERMLIENPRFAAPA
jgi:protein-tyrosine-phosphatase